MNILLGALLVAALVLIQCLIGGTRLVFSFPSYALVGVAAVVSGFSLRRTIPKASAFCVASTLLLAGYVAVRAWVSPVPYLARQDLFMAGAALAVYLLSAFYLNTSRSRMWVLAALLGVGVVHVIVGMLQFQWQNGLMLFGFVRGDVSPRASGMMISGNHMAGCLEALAAMALGLTVWSRLRIGGKLLTGYLVLFFYLGVVLSGSRGGYLSSILSLLAFGVLTLWIVQMYNRNLLTVVLVTVMVGGMLFLGTAGYPMTRNQFLHKRMNSLGRATQDVRVYNWLASLDQFKLSPVVGTGAGTHLYYGRLFRRPEIQTDPVHSHSDYLELLAEYGIIGELLAALFLAAHLSHGVQAVRAITLRRLCNSWTSARSDSLALTVGAFSAVVALVAHSVVDFNMHIPGNALLFAFFFGILSNPGLERPKPVVARLSPEMAVRVGLCLLGISLLVGVGLKYKGERLAEQARIALRNADYKASIEFAHEAIAADASNPYAYFYLGEAYRVTGMGMKIPVLRAVLFGKAIESYRGGLEHFPQDENLMLRLGQSFDGARQFDQAEAFYVNAIGSDPNLGLLYAYYGSHLQLIGQADAAKKNFERARQLGTRDASDVGRHEILTILDNDPEKSKGDVE